MDCKNNNTTPGPEAKTIDAAFQAVFNSRPPVWRTGTRVTVCPHAELPPGQRRIVEDGTGLSIDVFNVGGKLYALRNVCPHNGAPLCRGSLHGTYAPSEVHQFTPALEGRVLRCPWHGWEFDLATGKGLYDANAKVAAYAVEVDAQGMVVVIL